MYTNLIQLYCSPLFPGLTESNRIKNIGINEVVKYASKKWDKMDLNSIDIEYDDIDSKVMVVANGKDEMYWEYLSNWKKFRELNYGI
jgi:hypothetical protein